MKIFLTMALILASLAMNISVRAEDAQFADIQTAVLEEDFLKAKTLAEGFLSSVEEDPLIRAEAKYYLALSQLYLQAYAAARENFENLSKDDIPLAWREKALLGIVDSYYMAGDYRHALKKSREFLKSFSDSDSLGLLYLKFARANLRLARWKEAHKYLEKIVEAFPQSLEAHTAQQLLEEKQFFSVQVGSFLDQTRAEGLVNELKEQGEYAYIVETVDSEGVKFYRVRAGEFSDLHQAESLKTRLSSDGYPTMIYP
ncbi:MAG: SPOR domain-containing protein [Candidatus Omnitrophica bacterium]|nr:SPOR domain-containing protein [Candidatus Omnitrophota bacterium]